MRWQCKGPMGMHGHHHGFPLLRLFFATSMLSYLVMAIWLTVKLVRALDTMAMAKTLEKLGDRLSEAERDELEARIRENLFP